MKRIIIFTLILLLCGCQNQKTDNNQIDETNLRLSILKEKAMEIFSDEDNTKVGITISFLSNIKSELPNNKIFDNCKSETTRIEHMVYELENEVHSQYKIILDCDNIVKTYFYNNIEDNEPIGTSIIEKN